ncbi:MAG: MBL fold metallo-hydrolase [Gammaproteobacteria bacterium]
MGKVTARAVKRGLTWLGAAGVLAVILVGCASQPRYRGTAAAPFDGTRFYNSVPAEKSLTDILTYLATYRLRREAWPAWVHNAHHPAPPPAPAGVTATFINHSTVLLDVGGVRILTDPIYAERASPFRFAGPARVRAPGVPFADLPPIDVVLLSHDHYDHLDLETLARLHARDAPLVLAGLGNGALLAAHDIAPHRELDWWQSVRRHQLTFHFVEVRHRSGRGLLDQMMTLWGGFVIAAPGARIYFAGDTGFGPHFAAARQRFGTFDLCLLPIGAYRPRDFMAPVHLDPAAAVRAHRELGCRQSIAIHHGTFQLTWEAIDEPYAALAAALAAQGVPPAAFRVLGFGESLVLPALLGQPLRAAEASQQRVVAAPQLAEFVEQGEPEADPGPVEFEITP